MVNYEGNQQGKARKYTIKVLFLRMLRFSSNLFIKHNSAFSDCDVEIMFFYTYVCGVAKLSCYKVTV